MKRGKKYREAQKLIEPRRFYQFEEAIELVKRGAPFNFDETIELAIRLGTNLKDPAQQVRGNLILPHGTGREVRVLVFAKGDKAKEAKEAGADWVGAQDLIERISKGWTDFEIAIAIPDMVPEISKLGRVLGSKGLMPSPKRGTVTFEVTRAVEESKRGKIEYKKDKFGIIHTPIGKKSFKSEELLNNAKALLGAVVEARPRGARGQYLKSITLSSTMGPPIKLDPQYVNNLFG
jgi:large subunit ribosomal protein L1